MCRTNERPNPWIWLTVSAICLSLTLGAGYLLSAAFFMNGARHSATTGNWNVATIAPKTSTIASATLIQDSHSLYHNFYKDWNNGKGQGCCSDQDCAQFTGPYRYINGDEYGMEIFYEGEWVKIERWKILHKETPDGDPTLCILPQSYEDGPHPAQERIRCFNPGVLA